jgi:hypothetical protein
VAVRQNIKMLAPHFPPSLVPRFVDQQVRDSYASFPASCASIRKPWPSPLSRRCLVSALPCCRACSVLRTRVRANASKGRDQGGVVLGEVDSVVLRGRRCCLALALASKLTRGQANSCQPMGCRL